VRYLLKVGALAGWPGVGVLLLLLLPRPSWPPAAPVLRAQAGLIGGLQLWDVRAGGAGGPVASSPREWGHTGCADADAAAGAARA
jgi:hypothetical protein